MKIYMVCRSGYEEWHIEKAFVDQAKAEKLLKELEEELRQYQKVEAQMDKWRELNHGLMDKSLAMYIVQEKAMWESFGISDPHRWSCINHVFIEELEVEE